MNGNSYYPETLRLDIQKIVEKVIVLWGHPKADKIKDTYTFFHTKDGNHIGIYNPGEKLINKIQTNIYTIFYDLHMNKNSAYVLDLPSNKIFQIYGCWENEDSFIADEFCKKSVDMRTFDSFFREKIKDNRCQEYIHQLTNLLESISI